jgi:hypothetical protein
MKVLARLSPPRPASRRRIREHVEPQVALRVAEDLGGLGLDSRDLGRGSPGDEGGEDGRCLQKTCWKSGIPLTFTQNASDASFVIFGSAPS